MANFIADLAAAPGNGHEPRNGHLAVDGEGPPPFDRAAAERAAADLLAALGADLTREGLAETPRRMVDAYVELLTPRPFRATTFANEEGYDELVLVRAIPFHSLCMHHVLPFHGVAHVGYIPGRDGRVTGLSKIARLVDLYAKRPQVQERLTTQIADALMRKLDPRGAIVVIEAEHLCMSMRGVRKHGATTTTSAVRGQFKSDNASRAEALDLILRR